VLEFQTLTVPVFADLFSRFYDDKRRKVIPDDIVKDLNAISLAYWFAGDGGKFDFTGHSKSISLHTQGFKHQEVLTLVAALSIKFGWDVVPIRSKGKDQWYIKIKNFDQFITLVGPYIHPSLVYKLPTARSDKMEIWVKINTILFAGLFMCFANIN
jgi:hypothetical protein